MDNEIKIDNRKEYKFQCRVCGHNYLSKLKENNCGRCGEYNAYD